MTVYFVRHAQSDMNKAARHQTPDASMTETGKEQAKLLGEKLKTISASIILSSPLPRAKHTTEIANQIITLPVEYSALLVERSNPKEVAGLLYDHPEAIKITQTIFENYENPHFRFSTEETFFEIKERGKKILEFITKRKEEKIIVVTHGHLLPMIFALMAVGESLLPYQYLGFDKFMMPDNASITTCEYSNTWKLVYFNDTSHLERYPAVA